jgi:hypothetical protein
MDYLEAIRAQFNDRVRLKPKRPGVMQLFAPLYHEDGDMVDIFIEQPPDRPDQIRVCDHGMALMRLSYAYDVDSPTKERVLGRILSENGVGEQNGNLYIDAAPDELGPAILQFAQTVSKVSAMRAYRREVVHSLFFEQLAEIVNTRLQRFNPRPGFFPLPEQEEYEVDYCFNGRERPVYLFGVNSQASARLAIISCLKFITESLKFYGAVVLEDLDVLGKKDRTRLLSASDKVFPTLDDFGQNGAQFLEREAA